jgi:hypothetical protein
LQAVGWTPTAKLELLTQCSVVNPPDVIIIITIIIMCCMPLILQAVDIAKELGLQPPQFEQPEYNLFARQKVGGQEQVLQV